MEVSFSSVGWNAPIEFIKIITGPRLQNFENKHYGNSVNKVFIEIIVLPESKTLKNRTKYHPEHKLWDLSLVISQNSISGNQSSANCHIAKRISDGLMKSARRLKVTDFDFLKFINELEQHIHNKITGHT
ncbi:MAG: hypothetical protein A2W44_06485 [Acinetobacter sp. RIFCSPHIGHO2_12_41_5]|nr:MAG: hypothetical protein A2W44_06485 [Acinetobacter sp. RIFCSPHIGHO2_12_41_5]